MNSLFKAGYAREIVTPENGTWLGGYGNASSRPTIGKVFEDDDLFVTAITLTDKTGETLLLITVDLVRMPINLFRSVREKIVKETGIKEQNIMISATHSHSSPEMVDTFIEAFDNLKIWAEMFSEQCVLAVKNSLKDRRFAEIYIGRKKLEKRNFVRRYMKDGEFLGTNRIGDAHETEPDNTMQVIRFARKDAKDIVLVNWGAHADHSKEMGGEKGTPEFQRGCSADYIYPFRKTVEEKADVHFAFFQAAAGNLNPHSKIEEENEEINRLAEKEGVKKCIAYGEDLAKSLLEVLNTPLKKVDSNSVFGAQTEIKVNRPKGVEIGSSEYNKAYAVSAVLHGKRTIEKPTAESISASRMVAEKYNLGGEENIKEILKDEEHPLYTYAECYKILKEGGKLSKSNQDNVDCAKKIAPFFGINSGPYGTEGLIKRAQDSKNPPFDIPLYAFSFGDVAFVGTPGEPFDSNGMDVKSASPFKMTFYCEHTGGAFGYYPSKLAWQHGGYEVDATKCAEGTAEKISETLINLLNGLKTKYI